MKSLFKTTTVVLGIALSACHSKALKESTTPADTYVKAVYSLPQTLDPIRMNDTASLLVSNLIYDGLLRFSSTLEIIPALAETWSSSSDGKTYTFKLRKSAKFHDGSPIQAMDVVASLTRAVSPGSTVYKYYDCIRGADEFHSKKSTRVSGIRKTSDDSLEIELDHPFPPFLSILAGATAKILPEKLLHDGLFFQSPVGSGPFRIESTAEKEIRLTRFDSYYGDRAKIEKLVLRELSESDAIKEAKDGTVADLSNFPISGMNSVFSTGHDLMSPVAATWIIGLNTRLAPFNTLKVRQAFKASADTEGFRKTFYPDALQAKGYIPVGLPGNIEEAVVAKTSAKATTQATIKIAFPELLENERAMRDYLQKSYREAGWNVEFIPMSWAKLMEGYDNKTLQAFVVSMNMDYPDSEFLIRNFESKNPDNFSGVSDSALDRLIADARRTNDRMVRSEIYKKIAGKIEDLAVTVNLFHPRAHNWVSPCVKGFEPNILADYYIDYRKIELDGECQLKRRGRS